MYGAKGHGFKRYIYEERMGKASSSQTEMMHMAFMVGHSNLQLANTAQTEDVSGDEGYKTIKYSERKNWQPPDTSSKHQANILRPF